MDRGRGRQGLAKGVGRRALGRGKTEYWDPRAKLTDPPSFSPVGFFGRS